METIWGHCWRMSNRATPLLRGRLVILSQGIARLLFRQLLRSQALAREALP